MRFSVSFSHIWNYVRKNAKLADETITNTRCVWKKNDEYISDRSEMNTSRTAPKKTKFPADE